MNIYFIRHGETDWNVENKIQGSNDIDLNENGINQALALGEKVKTQGLLFTRYIQVHKKGHAKLLKY